MSATPQQGTLHDILFRFLADRSGAAAVRRRLMVNLGLKPGRDGAANPAAWPGHDAAPPHRRRRH